MGRGHEARPRRRARSSRRRSCAPSSPTIAWSPSGIASCTEVSSTPSPSASTRRCSRRSRSTSRSRRCTSRTTWRRSGRCSQRAPDLPQVACFDTAFHRRAAGGRAGVRAAEGDHRPRRAPVRVSRALLRVHRAARCRSTTRARRPARRSCCTSATAPACARSPAARSVASTMGFTAADGLPMGTRCGSLDPGVMLYLMDELKMDARAIEKLIYQQSGLLGVSGISSDMRTLEASARAGGEGRDRPVRLPDRPRARLARGGARRARRDRVHRRHRREQRAAARARLPRCGVARRRARPRRQRRAAARASARAGSRVSAWVIPTNEELMIARHTRHCRSARTEGSEQHDGRNSAPRAEGHEGAGRRRRQRALDRLGLRQGIPRARRGVWRSRISNEKARPYVEPLAQRARGADLPAARRRDARAAGGGVRRDRARVGPARHPRPFDRLRAEGGPAGRAAQLLGRGLRKGDGRVVPLVRPDGAARRAADEGRRHDVRDELPRRATR